MNETVILWILGGYAVGAAGFGSWAMMNALANARDHAEMSSANAKAHSEMTERLAKLETIISMFGEKAAKILHSPHTPELDQLLERYCDRYYELADEEWGQLLSMCNRIEDDPKEGRDTRALAAWLSAVCQHKLMMPAPVPVKHG